MISNSISGGGEGTFPFKRWMAHTAMVPKGFLRYQVLRLLREKPMSGSEIMSEVERQTNGHWRPSPGSIYPLLAWLQDEGHIKRTDGEEGVKRYMLTEQGKTFLEEHIKVRQELRERFQHFWPGFGFMGPIWFDSYPERVGELLKAARDLAIALQNLRGGLRREYSEKAVEEARRVLEEAAKSIEEITRRLQE